MITVNHNNNTYQFFITQNALNIKLTLQYFTSPTIKWSFTDVFSPIKREDISVPDEVVEMAKSKAVRMMELA